MTVSTTTNKISYIGNGIATEFAIPFPFLETAHLKVYQLLNDIQTKRTDWTVSNGNMIFETPPANGAQIVILREVPLTQETDYQENEILAAETLERNFDRLTMQVQQLKEQSERAVTVDIFDDTQAADLLPSIRTAVSDAAAYAQEAKQAEENVSEAEMNISTLLEVKANVHVDNLSAIGKKNISSLSGLGKKVVSLVFGASGCEYTAPSNGAFFIGKNSEIAEEYLYADIFKEGLFIYAKGIISHGASSLNLLLPVRQGDLVRFNHNLSGSTNVFHFIYANGCE